MGCLHEVGAVGFLPDRTVQRVSQAVQGDRTRVVLAFCAGGLRRPVGSAVVPSGTSAVSAGWAVLHQKVKENTGSSRAEMVLHRLPL